MATTVNAGGRLHRPPAAGLPSECFRAAAGGLPDAPERRRSDTAA